MTSKRHQQIHNEDLHNEFYQNEISIVTETMVFTGCQSLNDAIVRNVINKVMNEQY